MRAPDRSIGWLGFAFAMLVCGLAPLAKPGDAAAVAASRAIEWPSQWEGLPLRPLALSAVEQRFAARFPGHIGRFTDGEQVLVMRDLRQPTRMLHPAADCYRGLGYRIEQARLERDAHGDLWRCFIAQRGGSADTQRVRVCERIVDSHGRSFTDASSWFWAAQLGQSTGPWRAITTARSI